MTLFDDPRHTQEAFIDFLNGNKRNGSFMQLIIDAIFHADEDNLSRLELGFPALVGAYKAYTRGLDVDSYPIIKEYVKG